MEFILGAVAALFLGVMVLLAWLEIELAWAVGIASAAVVVVCVGVAFLFGGLTWATHPVETVRSVDLAQLIAVIAAVAALAYGTRRYIIAKKAKNMK